MEKNQRDPGIASDKQGTFAHSRTAGLILDPEDERIVEANDSAARLLGYERGEQLRSMPVLEICPHGMERFQAFQDSVFRTGHGWTDQLTCVGRDGAEMGVEISASRMLLDGWPRIIAWLRRRPKRTRSSQWNPREDEAPSRRDLQENGGISDATAREVLRNLGKSVARMASLSATLRAQLDIDDSVPVRDPAIGELDAIDEALAREAGALLFLFSKDRGRGDTAALSGRTYGVSDWATAEQNLVRILTGLVRGQSRTDDEAPSRDGDAGGSMGPADLEIQMDGRTAIVRGTRIHLGQRQLRLLEELNASRGQIVPREALQERAWAGEEVSEDTLTTAVHRLRRRLQVALPVPAEEVLVTVRGVGYVLESRLPGHAPF